jgi:glutamate-ammonia-ligase adenylyltransferase
VQVEQIADIREKSLRAGSRSLAALLDRDEKTAALLGGPGPLPDRAGYLAAISSACESGGLPELRLDRRRRLAEIAARDLAGELSLEEVGAALADLADACLEIAIAEVGAPSGLCIIAMGKLGGQELNYSSDIDVMFVTDGDLEAATKAAESLLSTLGEFSPEGQAYRIDVDLRPEGRSGALVRSLEGFVEYYKRWAHAWEFQALIKARSAAGNESVGDALIAAASPFIYPTDVEPERVADIRAMKQRVEEHALRSARRMRRAEADDVKLGPGGIRDIEFSVQLLQLVHGGSDESVRSRSTLGALDTLAGGGYIADDDAAGLTIAYRWLRTVEHRLQLWQERQIHKLPVDDEERARLARVLGFVDSSAASAAERFDEAHGGVLADVRGRFEKLFYRPMIESLAESGPHRLSEQALKQRLRAFGFRDVDRAGRTLGILVAGTSRRARLFKVLTPAFLRFLASTPQPDQGLFSFLTLGESLHDRIDTLGAFRDNPPGLNLLAQVLGSGRLLGEVLTHVPEELTAIAERSADPEGAVASKDRERLVREAIATLTWREPEKHLDGLRRYKRREMLRVALNDVAGVSDPETVGAGLSDIADACLEAALRDLDVAFAVVGMGKLGGRELTYASDVDVMFVHDCNPAQADRLATTLVRTIGEVTPEGQAFRIDAALRPEGKAGPLVRSLTSYLEYYERWAHPWEYLALVKARSAAGAAGLGDRFVDLARGVAYKGPPSTESLAEIRHLKARMERERVPRGTDPRRHMKLGPGGTSDIEFAVQILQFKHGHEIEELRDTSTLGALRAAAAHALLDHETARRLDSAYRFLTRLRNRLFFIAGRPVDAVPTKPEEMEALGIAMGFIEQPRQELEEAYLRTTRVTRRIAEPLIYE